MTEYRHVLACSKCGGEFAAYVTDEEKPLPGPAKTGCPKCGGVQEFKYIRTEKKGP